MKTETVNQIENFCLQLKEAVGNFHTKDHKGVAFGDEGEYDARSIKALLLNLVTLCRSAVNRSDIFVQTFTHADRQAIRDNLSSIVDFLPQNDLPSVVSHLGHLTPYTNRLHAVFGSEQRAELASQVHEYATQITNLQEILNKAQASGDNISAVERRITELREKLESLDSNIDTVSTNATDTTTMKEAVEVVHKEVATIINATREFFNQIEGTQTTISTQKETFKDYESQMKSQIEQASNVIKQARQSLAYGERAGLCAAFSARVEEDKAKEKWLLWWFASATFFGLLAMFLGTILSTGFLVPESFKGLVGGTSLLSWLAKITITGIPFSAGWFCLSRYSREKNLAEDYKYKAVVVQSMEAFLAQFHEKENERALYVNTVFQQVFQDPMRKKHDVSTPLFDLVSYFKNSSPKNNHGEQG